MTQLQTDFETTIGRRRALGLIGGTAGGLLLAGCSRQEAAGKGSSATLPGDFSGTMPDGSQCVAFPPENEGPFPADGRGWRSVANVLEDSELQRRDIRSSFDGLTGVAQGVPLEVELQLVDVDKGCAPMAGAAIYVWHCDAEGEYSLYTIKDQNYLRGLQVADARGMVRFTTVYPGCYRGRFPHIHFELFESLATARRGSNAILTSQLALPDESDAAVYADHAAYPGSAANFRRISLASDGIFRDNSPAEVAAQTMRMNGSPSAGYTAAATIGYSARR